MQRHTYEAGRVVSREWRSAWPRISQAYGQAADRAAHVYAVASERGLRHLHALSSATLKHAEHVGPIVARGSVWAWLRIRQAYGQAVPRAESAFAVASTHSVQGVHALGSGVRGVGSRSSGLRFRYAFRRRLLGVIGLAAVAGIGALIVAAAQQAAGPTVARPADASATTPARAPVRRDYGIEPILSSAAPAASSDAPQQAAAAAPAANSDARQPSAPAPGAAEPAAPSASIRLRLRDVGGAPVLFEPSAGALRQDPGAGGTNNYLPGDVFVDPTTGQQWVWVGNASVVSELGVVSIESFAE